MIKYSTRDVAWQIQHETTNAVFVRRPHPECSQPGYLLYVEAQKFGDWKISMNLVELHRLAKFFPLQFHVNSWSTMTSQFFIASKSKIDQSLGLE